MLQDTSDSHHLSQTNLSQSSLAQSFIHLSVYSSYSLSKGAVSITQMIKWAKTNHMPAIAMVDMNNAFGAFEFSQHSVSQKIMPILGTTLVMKFANTQGVIKILVKNEQGYRNFVRIMHILYLEKPEPVLEFEDIQNYTEGLMILTGGLSGVFGQLLHTRKKQEAEKWLQMLDNIAHKHVYIEIQRHNIDEERYIEPLQLDLALTHNLPIVATNNCFFLTPDYYQAHDVLLCIGSNEKLVNKDREKSSPEYYLKTAHEMVQLFEDLPEAIDNTLGIARQCGFALHARKPSLPLYPVQKTQNEEEYFTQLVWTCFDKLLLKLNKDQHDLYKKRLQYELDTILSMDYTGYFLIVWDFITWAKKHDIAVGPGRGSGAGSLVAYVLGITQVNPLEFGLIFERFLNKDRISMPDFDIDFEPEHRDDVIAYVQQQYGQDHVSHIITFGTFQARAIVRAVGKVLNIPYSVMDQLSKQIHNTPQKLMTLEMAQKESAFQSVLKEHQLESVLSIALKLEGLYGHASTHAAGVVISKDPLSTYMPLFRDSKASVAATQFNMKGVEQMGMVKFDFLGLATLTIIKTTVAILLEETKQRLDVESIPLDDNETYNLLSKGYTLGVFQLESYGMVQVLTEMQPYRFSDIVALISLYRPGPMDNIPEYLARRKGKKEIQYIHPLLKDVLEETYGIPIYQEQVMEMARIMAGYSMGQADILRSAMGKKIAKQMQAQRQIFVDKAVELHKLKPAFANQMFDTIASFAGYGFNKSHAVSYALMSYQTAYLKTHYPLFFMVALLRNDRENTDKLRILTTEAKRMGLQIIAPDVNTSFADFQIKGESSILYGLSSIKGLGHNIAEAVIQLREEQGEFVDIFDFLDKVQGYMNKRVFEALLESGALDSLFDNRFDIWQMRSVLLNYQQSDVTEGILFAADVIRPTINKNHTTFSFSELMEQEKKALGFYLSQDPLQEFEDLYKKLDLQSLEAIDYIKESIKEGENVQMMGMVSKSNVIKSRNKDPLYMITLTDGQYNISVAYYSTTYMNHKLTLTSGQSLLIYAKMQTWGKNQPNARNQWVGGHVELLKDVVKDLKRLDVTVPQPELEKFLTCYKDIQTRKRQQIYKNKFYIILHLMHIDPLNAQDSSSKQDIKESYKQESYKLGVLSLSSKDLNVLRPWM